MNKYRIKVEPELLSRAIECVCPLCNVFKQINYTFKATTNTTKQNLQLIGLTALFIASKYEELYPQEISDFEYISDNTYSKKQILQTEQKICRVRVLRTFLTTKP